MIFDRARLLDTDTYMLNETEFKAMLKHNTENNQSWHNMWTENANANWEAARGEKWIDADYGMKTGPVIICGAGPSLSYPENIEALKELHETRTPIIACDKAYRTLLENGITPNLTITDDAQKDVDTFFEGLPIRGQVSPAIITHPAVVGMIPEANRIWHGTINPFSYWWQLAYKQFDPRIGTNLNGAVVGYTCADIACWLGYDTVISIGNELCYHDMESAKAECIFELHELESGKVINNAFHRAEASFCSLVVWHPEKRFVDCSGGIIRNWEKKSLEEMEQELTCAILI